MSQESLEDVLQRAGSAVQLLRNSQIGPYAFPVVPSEFTNWRDECAPGVKRAHFSISLIT